MEVGAVRYQNRGAGVFKLITDFSFSICRVEQSGNRSRQLGSVKCDAKFPGIGEEDGDDVARLDPVRDQATRNALNGLSVFGVRQTPATRGVNQCGFLRIAVAGVKYKVMQKEVVWIRIQLSAQHAGSDCTGNTQVFNVSR